MAPKRELSGHSRALSARLFKGENRGEGGSRFHRMLAAGSIGISGLGALALATNDSRTASVYADVETPAPPGHPAAKLPTMALKVFRAGQDERVWVAMDGGVYDVTPFLDAHPGGAHRIMMVHGQDLSKFWGIYQLHDRPHIRALLEEYRIGNLTSDDYLTIKKETTFSSAYANDPVRPKAEEGKLRIPSQHPWNSEPSDLSDLVETFYTPNDLFFVRNHNAVPVIPEEEYELEVEANEKAGIKARKFTLKELKALPRHEVVSALQCAGNRQEDYVTSDRPLYVAPHWRNGAIGNAKWVGVKVRDVLRECGMDVDAVALGEKPANAKIANFIAYDTDETGVPYAGVIPVEKALDPFGDAILAYEMNGETLPRDHGYPIRLLAPGHAGCRNVKWVQTIALTDEASELDSGSRLDRHFAPDISWMAHKEHVAEERCPERKGCTPCAQRVRTDQGPVIQTLPIQSIICVPGNRTTLSGNLDEIEVKGVAWSGAGRGVCRVEVSIDGGNTFTACELRTAPRGSNPPPEAGQGRNHAWTQWEAVLKLPEDVKAELASGNRSEVEICCKAIDGDFNVQPERMSHGWNVLGICVNHWSRVQVKLDPSLPKETSRPAPATPRPGSPYWGDGTHNKP